MEQLCCLTGQRGETTEKITDFHTCQRWTCPPPSSSTHTHLIGFPREPSRATTEGRKRRGSCDESRRASIKRVSRPSGVAAAAAAAVVVEVFKCFPSGVGRGGVAGRAGGWEGSDHLDRRAEQSGEEVGEQKQLSPTVKTQV